MSEGPMPGPIPDVFARSRPELPPFAECVGMIAAATSKLADAGMPGSEAGRVALELFFSWSDYR